LKQRSVFIAIFIGLSQSMMAVNDHKNVLKSFNFKVYYSEGGYQTAKNVITEAETSLETMENFLGTRLVEQVDIFLSESTVIPSSKAKQRNGTVLLNNSSLYLAYTGNSKQLFLDMKEQLAEILINGMLYGNTIKERLKNNREINVPDWYVPGLAKYVAGGKEANTNWLADYYEGKLKLNLNLSSKTELALFGQAVFSYINDSFGVNKLRQLLFYTKLAGKTDYAFQYVLNKSLNWVVADWFKMEKARYLLDNKERLPNDPEPLNAKLRTAQILELKFNAAGTEIDWLIKNEFAIEIWNYNLITKTASRKIKLNQYKTQTLWRFSRLKDNYYLVKSDGLESKLYIINNQRIINSYRLDFSYVHLLKASSDNKLYLLAQQKYKIDIFQLNSDSMPHYIHLTNNEEEEMDFDVDSSGAIFISVYNGKSTEIRHLKSQKIVHTSKQPIKFLNAYRERYLSFIKTVNYKNVGFIVNINDSTQVFQITNYNRSIWFYDYNSKTQQVMEVLNYGKQNYLVLSEASFDKVIPAVIKNLPIDTSTLFNDSILSVNFSYKFITGFEHKKKIVISNQVNVYYETKTQIKIKELKVSNYEFKAHQLKLGFTNSQFFSPLFASFFPIKQGIYNGPNILIGSSLIDISSTFFLSANLRQPIVGKGTDFDFTFKKYATFDARSYVLGLYMYQSNYQKELYNQDKKFAIREVRAFINQKLNPKIQANTYLGFRSDVLIPLSNNAENIKFSKTYLHQAYFTSYLECLLLNRSKINFTHKLTSESSLSFYKPFQKSGLNTNISLKLKYHQQVFRLLKMSTHLVFQSSVGKQKTVWLMGGVSNWLQPVFGNAKVYNEQSISLYSTSDDFEGLPYNFKAGTSLSMLKFRFTLPFNPLISQQNFNQNFLKFMSLHTFSNFGMAWFGKNPYAIKNSDNLDIIETGSMVIENYVAKNPLIWSYGFGMNTVLFGYDLGFDHAIGHNEQGKIGQFNYLTIGKEF
jgi:hypothetical protein